MKYPIHVILITTLSQAKDAMKEMGYDSDDCPFEPEDLIGKWWETAKDLVPVGEMSKLTGKHQCNYVFHDRLFHTDVSIWRDADNNHFVGTDQVT